MAMQTTTTEKQKLPEDILSRLPVKSLLRFRSVCKPWCALITDPGFVKMHLNRSLATNTKLSIIFSDSSCVHSVDFYSCEQQVAVKLDHQMLSSSNNLAYHTPLKILGSCNGLLCIRISGFLFIWNPSTRRRLKLPIEPIEFLGKTVSSVDFSVKRFVDYEFGYDPTTNDYKLVRIVQFKGHEQYSLDSEVKVYSLNANSWKRIQGMPFPLSYYPSRFGDLVNSMLHWVAKVGLDPASNFIVSFDLKDEEYRELSLPEEMVLSMLSMPNCLISSDFVLNVGVLGGKLCVLLNFVKVRVEVWVMKDFGMGNSWAKLFSIEKPLVLRSFRYIEPICYPKNGEVIFDNNSKKLFLYDPRRGRGRNLRIGGQGGVPKSFRTNICFGSLVPLNVPLNAKDEAAKNGTEHAERKEKYKKRRKEQNQR